MNKLNQTLSEVLDVEPIEYQTTEIVEVKTPVEDDAEFARTNIRDLIQKGNSAVDNLLLVANASEHPRAYEVAAGLIKNLADLNKDLLEIQVYHWQLLSFRQMLHLLVILLNKHLCIQIQRVVLDLLVRIKQIMLNLKVHCQVI